jgi:recombinational DNA repair protein RecT
MSETTTAPEQQQAVVRLTPHQLNVKEFRRLAESPAYLGRFKQVLDDRAPQFVASLVQAR